VPTGQHETIAEPDLELARVQSVLTLGKARHGYEPPTRAHGRSCKLVIGP
jgi:hypothetical protein